MRIEPASKANLAIESIVRRPVADVEAARSARRTAKTLKPWKMRGQLHRAAAETRGGETHLGHSAEAGVGGEARGDGEGGHFPECLFRLSRACGVAWTGPCRRRAARRCDGEEPTSLIHKRDVRRFDRLLDREFEQPITYTTSTTTDYKATVAGKSR